jgi:hypothetical protein
MATDIIDLTSPEDTAAAQAWAAQRGTAAAQLSASTARRGVLAASLSRPDAVAALGALASAQDAAATAQRAVLMAQQAQAAADTAARAFAGGELAAAQQELDDATAAVSAELGRLLAEASTSTSLTATIDGLSLRERYRAATGFTPPVWDLSTIPFRAAAGDTPADPQLILPVVGDTDYTALLDVLARLDERVDAIVDLVAAESVHHLVNGNPVRSGAALALAASGAVPDALEVIRTPSAGHDVTQRLLVLLDATAAPAWTGAAAGAATLADPVTSAWLSTLLPDPASVGAAARLVDPGSGAVLATQAFTADALGLGPLDWLRVASAPAELTARVARLVRGEWPAGLTGRVVVADPEPGPGHPGQPLVLADLLSAATAGQRLLTAVRALAPADLQPATAEAPAAAGPETVALVRSRVEAVTAVVDGVVAALHAAAAATSDEAAVLDALLAASALGVAEAVPAGSDIVGDDAASPGWTAGTGRAQAAVAAARLAARTSSPADDRVAAGVPADVALARIRERLAALAGVRLPILVPVPRPQDDIILADLGAAPSRIPGTEPERLREWLDDHARVRPAVEAMAASYSLAEGSDAVARLDLRVTQLPTAGPRPWSGTDPAPPAGALDVVAVRGYPAAVPAMLSGAAVDAWTRMVPDQTHRTGVAFHFDEPDAEPPQVLLVAVAPDTRPGHRPGTWDLDTLVGVVTSTVALARLRARAAELVPGAGVTTGGEPA